MIAPARKADGHARRGRASLGPVLLRQIVILLLIEACWAATWTYRVCAHDCSPRDRALYEEPGVVRLTQ